MRLKNLIFVFIFLFFSVKICFSAETIFLKNGKSFEGKILDEKENKYIVEKYNAELNATEIVEIKKEDIAKIEKPRPIKKGNTKLSLPEKNIKESYKLRKAKKLPIPIPLKLQSEQINLFFEAKNAVNDTSLKIFSLILPNTENIPFLKKYAYFIFISLIFIIGFTISLLLFRTKNTAKGLCENKFLETPYKPLKKIKKIKNPFPFIKVFVKPQKEIKNPYYECICRNINSSNIELISEETFDKNETILITIILKKQIGKIIDYEDQSLIAVVKEVKQLNNKKYEINAEFQHLLLRGKAFITKISNKKVN